jgi:putative peptide zinc metalloprotease protein
LTTASRGWRPEPPAAIGAGDHGPASADRPRSPARDRRPVAPLDLVLPDGGSVPLAGEVTIGRAPGNRVRLDDPAVSRRHARIVAGRDGATLQDVGSRFGTWVDERPVPRTGARLADGSRIRVGDHELLVRRRRTADEAGATIVVPAGASRELPAAATAGPRLRSGYALKRLAPGEGPDRWVLHDLRSGKFLRVDDADGRLLELLDGRRALPELLDEARRRDGPEAAARLARLLTELRDRELLAGGPQEDGDPPGAARGPGRRPAPRRLAWTGAGALIERLYRAGGRLLFTRPALVVLAALAPIGVGVFAALVAGRYGTPFVVASKVGLGGVVFVAGRFALVTCHELAHGLALAAAGRRAGAVGLKLVLVFPYAYVDTSEAWFEPRARRIAVSAAGPASDVTLGALFALACLYVGPGTVRDVLFQLALAAYLGALFNLNPFVDRDGYQILTDVLREPALRPRARAQLAARLRGDAAGPPSRVLTRYAWWGLAWSVLAAGFAAALSLRYRAVLETRLPPSVAWALLATLWAGLLAPAVLTVLAPVLARVRRRAAA